MLRIGLIGTGHLGSIHAKCISEIPALDFAGVFDIDPSVSEKVASQHGTTAFKSLDQLIKSVDIVDIVTPTTTHHEIAKTAFSHGKHVFIEKPVAHSVKKAKELLALQRSAGVKAAVGHVERYNPALLALEQVDLHPGFIEGHRLAMYNPRGTDVSVVLDLMIHDLDIILKLVDSNVKAVHSKMVTVLSKSDDICNARIEFENGCVVNLTASRLSLKNMRKLRIFQEDAYISIDFLEKESQIIRMVKAGEKDRDYIETEKGKFKITIDLPNPPVVNAIKMELSEFAKCIETNEEPKVSLDDGYQALLLAHMIIQAGDKASVNSLAE